MTRWYWILLITVTVLFSCRKPSDESLPVVTINTPGAGTFFHVFDTVFVNLTVKDNLNLEWVKLDIINDQNILAVSTEIISGLDQLEETINAQLILDDIHLESGDYHIRATVSDGENENYAFREINIFEAPLRRLKVLAVSNPTPSTTAVDSLFEEAFYPATQWDQKANFLVANSWDRELLMIAEASGDIQMYHGPDFFPGDFIPGIGNGLNPDYNSVEFHADFRKYYCTRYVGEIETRNPGGHSNNSFASTAGFRPYSLDPVGAFLIVEERNLAGTNSYVSAYNRNSGVLQTSLSLEADLVEITHQGDDVWLWGNQDGEAKLWHFDPVEGFVTETHTFGSVIGPMNSVAAMPDGRVGIAFQYNSIQVDPGFQPSLGTLWDYGGAEIDYDIVENEFFVRSGNTLYALAPGDNNPHAQIALPQNTVGIDILYNK